MIKFLASLVLAVGFATVSAASWKPTPLGVALSVGRWIAVEREEVFEVRVQATGTTDNQAREEAFRVAVDRAVGSLIVVNTESQNNNITRHEVINYAAGYVYDFTVVSRDSNGREIQLVLDVRVKRSAIADRLLVDGQRSLTIPTTDIETRYTTIMRERLQGDRLLESVLRDYPKRAFKVELVQHQVRLTANREIEIELDVRLSLDHHYLKALQEILILVGSDRGGSYQHQVNLDYTPPGSFFQSFTQVGFDDDKRINILRSYFSNSNPQILVRITGSSNSIVTQCYSHNELSQTGYQPARRFVHWGENRTVIHGSLVTRPRIQISVPSSAILGLKQIDLEVVSQVQCRSFPQNHIYTRHGHS